MKNRKYLGRFACFLLAWFPVVAWSQETAKAVASQTGLMDWMGQNIIAVLGIITVIGAFSVIIYLNNVLMQANKIRLLQEHGIVEVVEEVKSISRESWWKTWYDKMTKVVPVKKEKEILFDHSYDGIQELDNVLPPWWVYMFYISIVFGIGYLLYFHVLGYGPSSSEEYQIEIASAQSAIEANRANLAEVVDENNVVLVDDQTALTIGQSIYIGKCAVCHGQNGEGGVGPNMTDDYWIHGGDIKDIFRTIKYGVPEKGMIAWSNQMLPGDMQKVSSYIKTLHGTNPPNAKEPQGERWEEPDPAQNAAMAVDSLDTSGGN